MIAIQYQNQISGEAWDISGLVRNPRWTTKRVGAASSLTFDVLVDSEVAWSLGGFVALKDDDRGLFFGYIVKLSRSDSGFRSVTVYDQLFYLVQNSDTYVFSGKRADEVLRLITADFELSVGEVANTGYVIPSMVEDGQSLIDIILKALDLTLINTGQLFTLWDDFGKLRISAVQDQVLDLIVGDSSLGLGYTYEENIDSDTANRIKLVRDNEETLKRDVWIVEDSGNMTLWGILQYYEKVDEALNHAQIVARAENLLELKNRPMRSFSISAIADLSVRAGVCLFIRLEELGMAQLFVVDEAVHDLQAETMDIKLRVI